MINYGAYSFTGKQSIAHPYQQQPNHLVILFVLVVH